MYSNALCIKKSLEPDLIMQTLSPSSGAKLYTDDASLLAAVYHSKVIIISISVFQAPDHT
jgi:hypothetical protein